MDSKKIDVIIIGAGPAGCAAAAKLNQLGYQTIILEKCIFPRFVIGESLLPKCLDYLKEIGAFDIISQANFQYKNGARFIKKEQVCDFDFAEKSVDGWDYAWQVKRAEFDQLLVDFVQQLGVEVRFDATVNQVEFNEEFAKVKFIQNDKEHFVEGKYIIDASGYGRVLPRLLNLTKASSLEKRNAFFAHIKSDKLAERIDINKVNYVISDSSLYVWIIPFSDGTLSVGIVGDSHEFPEEISQNSFEQLISQIPTLDNQELEFTYAREPQMIKGFSSSVSSYYGDKFVLVGNTTEFLDPIFSSGVTIALESGIKGATLVADALNGKEIDWELEYESYMRSGVDVFKNFVESWYSRDLINIFFNDEKPKVFKQHICAVLAGYVWDKENPFIKKHKRMLTTLAHIVKGS